MIKRLIAYIHHACRAFSYLDGVTMFRLFVLRRNFTKLVSAKVKNLDGPFWYRGFKDRGTVSHLYEKGYYFKKAGGIQCIVDLGSNIGDETVKFAVRHPDAKIIAVEPEGGNFSILRKNIAPYGERIVAIEAGVWHRDALLDIIPGSTPEAFSVVESENGKVKARSMSSIIDEYKLTHIDILKIDIEGAEYVLFEQNSEQWLGIVDAIVIEIADIEKEGSFQNFFRALERAGFKANCFINGENIVAIRFGVPMSVSLADGTDVTIG